MAVMPEDEGANVPEICTIVAVPALAMAFGSAAVKISEPSEQLQARLQHLSAGVLIGAVITEIFPILRERLSVPANEREGRVVSLPNFLAAAVGFVLALILMYCIKALDLGSDDEAEGSAESNAKQQQGQLAEALLPGGGPGRSEQTKLRISLARLHAHGNALVRLVKSDEVDREALDEEVHGIDFLVDSARRLCRGAEPLDQPSVSHLRSTVGELVKNIGQLSTLSAAQQRAIDQQLLVAGRTLRQVHLETERATFRRWAPHSMEKRRPSAGDVQETSAPVPHGLILAVVVDSIIDGMLIGLAGSVSSNSGWLMALATAIEMGFLGYSFACAVVKSVRCLSATAILGLPPLAMIAAAATATAGATHVQHMPAFSGLVAFALVALLFLVVQELLVEAHEKEEGSAWHISIWLYIGLLMSISFDVIL